MEMLQEWWYQSMARRGGQNDAVLYKELVTVPSPPPQTTTLHSLSPITWLQSAIKNIQQQRLPRHEYTII